MHGSNLSSTVADGATIFIASSSRVGEGIRAIARNTLGGRQFREEESKKLGFSFL
jgi:hypothetical protein